MSEINIRLAKSAIESARQIKAYCNSHTCEDCLLADNEDFCIFDDISKWRLNDAKVKKEGNQ